MAMDSNVLSGNVSVKTGRVVKTADSNVCMISEELAAKNNLNVGDKLKFNDYHDKENSTVYEALIIGIYQVKQKMAPYMSGDTYRSENVIFTDLRFPEKAEGSKDDPLFEKAYFKVEDVDNYKSIKETVKKVDIDWQRYDLIDNNGNLDTMSSNFNDLLSISRVLIWVVAGASFVILFLVFVFWLKNRVQEVGILLALGTSKFRILGQILLETFMIAFIAIFISFFAAPSISKITANYLVAQQVQQAEETKNLNSGKVATDYQELEQEVTGVNVDITPEMLLFDGLGLSLLDGLDTPVSGTILYNGEDIRKKGLNHHRKHNVSLVFQNYNLIDYLTTEENVRLGGGKNPEKLLNEVSIPSEDWKRNVLQLSGGQQQRVAIARALASDAKVLLADEPTGNLDENTADEIIELLKRTAHELGKCVIVVTHSKRLANEADEIIQIKDSTIQINHRSIDDLFQM